MNLPDGWMVYPLMEVTIGLFVLLIAILVVLIMNYRVLKSFQQPQEPPENMEKEHMENLGFKDMR